jgi:hypothetical protein
MQEELGRLTVAPSGAMFRRPVVGFVGYDT